MKAAFFHDSIFIKKDDNFYTSGTLNADLFRFYLNYFDSIEVVTRFKIDNDNVKLTKSNLVKLDGVEFNCVLSYSKSIKTIKKAIKNCDVAIIRCHSFIGTIAAYFAKKYKKKYIVESVSCAFDCLWYHSIIGKIIAPLMYILTKKVVKSADIVSYVSSSFLQKRYPNNKITISCSDVVLKKKTYSINRYKKYNNINKRKIALGNISNIDMKYKGHKYLIKALNMLIKDGYDVQLYLVGSGKGKTIKKIIKKYRLENRVIFVGYLSHEKIFTFLNKIDIYVQPSIAESFGRVIVEAMSAGCPVIGSSAGGIPDLVSKNYIFRKCKWKELYKRIKYLIDTNDFINSSNYSLKEARKFNFHLLQQKKKNFFDKAMEALK